MRVRIIKEAIIGDRDAVQELIDSLSQEGHFSQYPGDVELGGSIQEKIENFLNLCFSIYPSASNKLGLFKDMWAVKRVFDSLSSFKAVWIVGNNIVDPKVYWSKDIDSNFTKKGQFAEVLPVVLRLNSAGFTVVEYTGNLRVGGTWKNEKNAFGTSLKIDVKLKYASADDFHPNLDPQRVSRYANLDFDSRKLEYHKVQHTPFTSLFRFGKDVTLFSKSSSLIKSDYLAHIAILASNGSIVGGTDSVQGDRKKTETYFRENKLYTNVEIEGLQVWDGRQGLAIEQPRLIQTIVREVDEVPLADKFVHTEYDIQVFLFNQNDQMLYKQLAKITITKQGSKYLGTILQQKEMKKIEQPAGLDLERIERDNDSLKDIQALLSDSINRDSFVSSQVNTKEFDQSVLSFIKNTQKVIVENDSDLQIDSHCYLGEDKQDLFDLKSLDQLPEWSDFKKEADSYDYTSAVTDEFEFDLSIEVVLPVKSKEEPVLLYTGTLSIELEKPRRTNVSVSLTANKTISGGREYKPKRIANRFSDLDY